MNTKNLRVIKKSVQSTIETGSYYYSAFADTGRKADHLTLRDIEGVVAKGEIIDCTSNNPHVPTFVLLGCAEEMFVHVSCVPRKNGYTVILASPPRLSFQQTC